jgi:hypothetical protein
MIRIGIAFILFVHGLIHLLGFVKEWQISNVKQLTGKTLFEISGLMAKTVGLFWLLATLLFVVSASAYLLKQDWWWIIASVALVLSQVLIIIYWQDARFGTIANIIVLIACILAYGSWDFNRMVKNEIPSFMPNETAKKKVISEAMLSSLPPVVQKWLRHSGVEGKELIHTAHLLQTGVMRTKPEGNWMPMAAEQYFTVDSPGFHWTVDVKAAPFFNLSGRDIYQNGSGNMLIKILSLVPVVDSKGKELNQGSMLRFLAEAAWFPSFALSNYISWKQVDSLTAIATMTYGGITASGIFKFRPNGDMMGFEAQRYYDRKEGATLETWSIYNDDNGYKQFEGVRIPAKSTVTWKLKSGDYTWFKVEIKNIEYNKVTDLNKQLIGSR